MFFYLVLCALYSDSVFTASLPRHPESISDLAAKPISSLNLLSPANILASSSNISSSGNGLKIRCDSTKYGKNLKVQSCRNVFRYLNKVDTQFTFAMRDSGVPFDVPLPLRTLSSKALTARPYNAPYLACNSTHITLTHKRQMTDYASSSQS